MIHNIFGEPTNEPKKISVIDLKNKIKEKLGQDENIVLNCVENKDKNYIELTGIYFYYETDYTPLKDPYKKGVCTQNNTVVTIWYKHQ